MMGFPDTIRFAYGKTLSGVLTKSESWDKIVRVITKGHRVYADKAESTNAPNILGGATDNKGKEARNILCRTMLTLDYDSLDEGFEPEDMAFALDMLGYAAVAYSTFSHKTERAEGKSRLRVIVPLSDEIEPRAYPAAVRAFTNELGIECSPESYIVAQIMFLPSCMVGHEAEAWTHVVDGTAYPVKAEWSDGLEAGGDSGKGMGGSGDPADDLLLDIAYEPLDVTDAEVDKALEMFPAGGRDGKGVEYDDWFMVGAALWHQYRGSLGDEGFGRWLRWSELCAAKHDARNMRVKWKSCGGRAEPVTMASVFARVGGLGAVRDALDEQGDGFDVVIADGGAGGDADGGGDAVKPKGALALVERFCEAAQAIEGISDYDKLKQTLLRVPERRLGPDYRSMIADEIYTAWGKGNGLSKGDIKKAIMPEKRRGFDGEGSDSDAVDFGDGRRIVTEADCWSDDRPAWLRGWVYDERDGEFVDVSNGHAIKREAFRMKFDRMPECEEHECDAVTLAAKVHPIPTVSGRMYWPGNGRVFSETGSGLSYLNTWSDGKCGGVEAAPEGSFAVGDDSVEGQACALFLRHLERTVADEKERALMLDWMAWVYSNPGSRVRWALLLWGIEGNGKSYFHRVLTWLMGRDSRTVAASLIEERFTDWAEGCRLIGIEEIRVSGTNKWRTLDKMKPFISNDEIQVEGKGKSARVVPNFASYMLFTNHADAIPIGDGDRRYFVIFTRHRTEADLLEEHGGEAGVGRYFQTLFDVSRAGVAGIGRLLLDHQYSDDFDPHGRAPNSSGKTEMRMLHLTEEDDALADALEKFRGPFINDKIIDLTLLHDCCEFDGEIELPKTNQLSYKLIEMGYAKVGRVKVFKRNKTLWYRPNKITKDEAIKAIRGEGVS